MNIYELEKIVNDYIKAHGMEIKKSSRNIDTNIYIVDTTDFTHIESKLIKLSNGKTKAQLKVDGKVTSLYK